MRSGGRHALETAGWPSAEFWLGCSSSATSFSPPPDRGNRKVRGSAGCDRGSQRANPPQSRALRPSATRRPAAQLRIHVFVFIAGDAQIRRTIIDINHPNEIMSSPWVTLLPVAYSEYTQLQYFNGKIYASSHSFERRRGAIFVTSNYGNTWKEINIYPPVIHAKTPIAVYQIYIQDNTIYAATNYGLYMSKNGIDWQCAGFKNKTVQSIYILNKTLHAAVYDDGIYSSSDSLHWDHEDDSSINKNKSDFGNINYNPFCITGKNTIIVGTSVGLYSVNG